MPKNGVECFERKRILGFLQNCDLNQDIISWSSIIGFPILFHLFLACLGGYWIFGIEIRKRDGYFVIFGENFGCG